MVKENPSTYSKYKCDLITSWNCNLLSQQRKVSPILTEHGINVEVLVTQYAGHAKEKMSSADLSEFDGIITVGGDGILYEVVNGLRCRMDSERVSNVRK